jgi:hypothetical protein
MRHRIGALVLTLALAGFAAGCGGDDVVGDVVPRSTPELTAPPDSEIGSGSATTNTTTTDTTATTTAPSGTAAPTTPAAPTQTAPQTGGAAPQPGGTGGGTGGGAAPDTGGASPGAFSEFCRQNPGACPDQ